MSERALGRARQEIEYLDDQDLVELAGSRLTAAAEAAVQEEGRTSYVRSRTRGSGTPVVVDDVERPSTLIEVWAPQYEDVLEYLAMVASPAVGLRLGKWLLDTATYWSSASSYERESAAGLAHELLGVRRG